MGKIDIIIQKWNKILCTILIQRGEWGGRRGGGGGGVHNLYTWYIPTPLPPSPQHRALEFDIFVIFKLS